MTRDKLRNEEALSLMEPKHHQLLTPAPEGAEAGQCRTNYCLFSL
jgi:hypothetical protein